MERQGANLALQRQAALLGLNRAHLYYQPVPPTPEELALKWRIDEIYTAWPCYGIRRITAQRQRQGPVVHHKAVARHMHEMGLAAIYPGPNTSKRAHAAAVYPYLPRGLAITRPWPVWSVDITYIRLPGGGIYLVAVPDW